MVLKLVESCSKQDRSAEAEGFGQRAVRLRLMSTGGEDRATLRSRAALARALVDVGKMDEAERILDLVQETCHSVFNEGYGTRHVTKKARAYLLFKQGRLDEAVVLQWSVVVNDTRNLDALLFLVQLYETLGNYEEACSFMQTASSLALSQSQGASGALEKIGLVKGYVQDLRLKTATGRVGLAVGVLTDALIQTNTWPTTESYALSELHLECLRAAEVLFQALGSEKQKFVLSTRLQVSRNLQIPGGLLRVLTIPNMFVDQGTLALPGKGEEAVFGEVESRSG